MQKDIDQFVCFFSSVTFLFAVKQTSDQIKYLIRLYMYGYFQVTRQRKLSSSLEQIFKESHKLRVFEKYYENAKSTEHFNALRVFNFPFQNYEL